MNEQQAERQVKLANIYQMRFFKEVERSTQLEATIHELNEENAQLRAEVERLQGDESDD